MTKYLEMMVMTYLHEAQELITLIVVLLRIESQYFQRGIGTKTVDCE